MGSRPRKPKRKVDKLSRWRTGKVVVYGVLAVVVVALLWYYHMIVEPERQEAERRGTSSKQSETPNPADPKGSGGATKGS